MGTISVTLPQDGTTADVADYNTPITTIVTAINGNLDSSNISSLSGTKITAASLPASAFDTNTAGGWQAVSGSFTYNANNGNKEFVINTPSDLTGILSAGMRLRYTRGTTPPTQCMSFAAASSQTAAKTSPSGLTFTGNFTCETWIYLLSYPTGDAAIIGRDNTGGGGSGWEFDIKSDGRIQLFWRNASGTSAGSTYQAIPLNRWVHIAASATVATPTAAFYINGSLVASTMTATGATSVVQATANLQMGRGNANTAYLNAYTAETRVWAAAQTQSSTQANMAINCAGSETNLVACFRGAGDFSDKTSNANTLTAANGAIATQAANPYNATEYAIITKVASSTLTVFTGNDYTVPNATVQNFYYSMVKTPFGFPSQSSKWSLVFPMNTTIPKSSSLVRFQMQNIGGLNFGLPTGSWKIKAQYNGLMTSSVSQGFNMVSFIVAPTTTVDLTNNLPYNKLFTQFDYQTAGTELDAPTTYAEDTIDVSSLTSYYLLIGSASANISLLQLTPNTNITFESAWI
jgi:hypothetical protein